MVTFLNIDLVDDHLTNKFPTKEASLSLSQISAQLTPIHVNIIFVDERLIRELNREYRDKDEETDVLSFYPAFSEVNEEKVKGEEDLSTGEIYVCPKYIIDQLDDRYGEYNEERFLEEVYRMIVHGLLHLSGMEHTTVLDYDHMEDDVEPMFVEQEKLLKEFTDDLKIKIEANKDKK